MRSISAVVDITNYVMLELGQPLHAYDNRLLEGDIVVRFARDGETLTLLNGQTLELESDLLLVCDSVKPLGLAGIMGHLGQISIRGGVISGFLVWLGFVITTMGVNHAFSGAPTKLTLIDGGYWLAVLLIQGAVIGAFGV